MIIKVLGSGQDAGIPHTGCMCNACMKAREKPVNRRFGPSLALIDKDQGGCYLIDASPDFKYQVDMLMEEMSKVQRGGKVPISGIFLTHAHYGHCAGLLQLGREVLDEEHVPVVCTHEMAKFLGSNHPFSLLFENKNVEIMEVSPGQEMDFKGFACTPFPVPHRSEVADCVGFSVSSKKSKKTLIYVPDTDHWTDQVLERIRNSDIALIDGTFYSKSEISGYDRIPHPPIAKTLEILEGIDTRIFFTHINHTNPVNFHGDERKHLEGLGFEIAFDGMAFEM